MNDTGIPKDHVDPGSAEGKDEGTESEESRTLEDNVTSKATWKRLFFMIVVSMLFSVSSVVCSVAVVLQFFWVLFTGETKPEVSRVGRQLASYAGEVIQYLTFNTEQRPFPFDKDWPSA